MQRPPRPALAPFVATLWSSEPGRPDAQAAARERVLPTGAMHVVIRIDEPLVIFEPGGAGDALVARTIGHAIIGGARASAYVRDISRPGRSVGAQLRPGAAELLLGAPANELAERHTRLDDVWGPSVDALRAQLAELADPAARLEVFERALLARVPRIRGVHPAVALAVQELEASRGERAIGEIVDDSGYSHRRFVALFERAVGLTPKRFSRVQRLQHAVHALAHGTRDLAALAVELGFSDQAHLTRELQSLAGLTPSALRALAPSSPNHVPIAAPGQFSSRRRGGGQAG